MSGLKSEMAITDERISVDEQISVREGTRRRAFIPLYPELLDLYLPMAGPSAILVWLELKLAALRPPDGPPLSVSLLAQSIGIGVEETNEALDRLAGCGLLSRQGATGELSGAILVVHDPLPADEFESKPGGLPVAAPSAQAMPCKALAGELAESVIAADEIAASIEEASLRGDLEALVDIYHQKIGLMGPMQFEKLRFWVEEKGMAAEVVVKAINETARSADRPRMQYLEGILRNWYNDGIRSYADLVAQADRAAHVTGKEGPSTAGHERGSGTRRDSGGIPNAQAYRVVDRELIRKWKERYPDEYDE